MTALRLLNTESQDKADYLHNQLITDINVPSTYWECAESYLKGVGIYDVFLIEEQDFRNYKIFLRETGNFTKKQVFERTGFLRNLKKTFIQEEYKELLNEIEQCNTVQERLKGNVRNFLIRQRIHHVKEIDYRIRELYESELRRTKTSSKGLEYLKTLDRIKQFDIRKEMETLSGRNKERLKYEGQVIFTTTRALVSGSINRYLSKKDNFFSIFCLIPSVMLTFFPTISNFMDNSSFDVLLV